MQSRRLRQVIEFAEEENARGAKLRPQTSARGIGGLFALDHRTPFRNNSAWRDLEKLAFAERVTALEDEGMVANDLKISVGGWTCGKNGQSVPVSQGLPTLRIDGSVTVGGVEASPTPKRS